MASGTAPEVTQLRLFEQTPAPGSVRPLAAAEPLTPDSTLETARWWYRLHLESHGHPKNTVAAYTNDLRILESVVGHKPLRLLDSEDIRHYLDSARRKSTRKRRLTSAREFFGFLIAEKVLGHDPTEPFFPERIQLKTPIPLFESERQRLMAAAEQDGPRSYLMVYLMLELGLNRTEVLNLRRQHVDISDAARPVVYVHYDDPRWRHKERTLLADERLLEAFSRYTSEFPEDLLFPVLPQAVNATVHRLARAAGLDRPVTPQILRDTFGVEQARRGKDEDELLRVLGLASDPRNRDSVRRYIRLAQPPEEVISADAG